MPKRIDGNIEANTLKEYGSIQVELNGNCTNCSNLNSISNPENLELVLTNEKQDIASLSYQVSNLERCSGPSTGPGTYSMGKFYGVFSYQSNNRIQLQNFKSIKNYDSEPNKLYYFSHLIYSYFSNALENLYFLRKLLHMIWNLSFTVIFVIFRG